MIENYEQWRDKQLWDDKPDLRCLESLLGAVQQYLACPESLASKGVLDTAIDCAERWIKERREL